MGMSKSSKQKNSQSQSGTSTTTPADPSISNAFNSYLIPQALSAASKPLQLYQGNLVAPLSSAQNAAIKEIQNTQGAATPYIQQAASLATQGTAPVTPMAYDPNSINQFMSPYISDVLNAQMALENTQNAEQQSSLAGSAAAAGAYGGDRSAVLQAQIARQQALANNATNSGILQQGFNTALGAAQNLYNTQSAQSLAAQQFNDQAKQSGAYTLAGLGNELQNAGLTGASALLGAGALQQQVAQEQLNVPYEQYLQQQGYPFQTLDFLSSILGQAAGSTGSTTTSSATGTSTGKSTVPFSILKDGGRVSLADGGNSNPFSPWADTSGGNTFNFSAPPAAADVPTLQSYVPDPVMAGTGAGGLHTTPTLQMGNMGGSGGGTSSGQGQSSLGGLLSKGLDAFGNGLWSGTGSGGVSNLGADVGNWLSGGSGGLGDALSSAASGAGDFLSSIGSGIADAATAALAFIGLKGGGRAYLADGGDPSFDDILNNLAPDAQPIATNAPTDGAMSLADMPPSWQGLATHTADSLPPPQGRSLADAGSPTWDDGIPVSRDDSAPDDLWAKRAADYEPQNLPQYQHDPSLWPAILSGVGSLLAHHSIGAGLESGVAEYEKDRQPNVDHSGPTTVIRYADGTAIDTGIPTEASLNARAMSGYRQDLLEQRREAVSAAQQAREDAIAQRSAAAADADLNRKTQLNIAAMNAGQPMPFPDIMGGGAASAPGGGDIYSQFASKMTPLENATGDRMAANPRSTAMGNGQFLNATWLQNVRQARPEWSGLSDQQILALRSDPAISNEMMVANAKANGQALQSAGQPVNLTTLALAHRFGPQGALSVLSAPTDAPLAKVLPPDVIRANPNLAGQTAGGYVTALQGQMGNGSTNAAAPPRVYGKFRNPQMISVPDGKGGVRQMMAQQSETTGQWVTADQNRTPIDAQGISLVPQGEIGMGDVPTPGNPALKGQQYLQTLPEGQRAMVQAMVDGRQAPPTSFALKTPYWQQMLAAANHFDPSFDQTTWGSRVKTRNSFTAGPDANNVTAINTALQHAGVVHDALANLHNTGVPLWNTIKNYWGEQTGAPAPTNAREAVDALASEGRKVFAGTGGGNLTELNNWQKNFPINGSPAQQAGALKEFVSLLDSRLDALTDKYSRGMGRAEDKLTLLSPHARAVYQGLTGQAPATNAPSQQAIQYLRSHPNLRADFDRKYGSGTAAQYLSP